MMNKDVFMVLSGSTKPIQIEIAKPVVEKMQEQTLKDLFLIQTLSGNKLRERRK